MAGSNQRAGKPEKQVKRKNLIRSGRLDPSFLHRARALKKDMEMSREEQKLNEEVSGGRRKLTLQERRSSVEDPKGRC